MIQEKKIRGATLPLFDPQLLAALGVLAAGLLLSEVNLLASRSYVRIDLSESQKYSLSEVSQELLRSLEQPIKITVLLPAEAPALSEARQLLQSYRAESEKIRLRFLDPDNDAAEFLALKQKLGLGENGLERGDLNSAAFLIENEKRHWFVGMSELQRTDAEGNEHSRMESALSEGIARVLSSKTPRLCFVTGHGERSLDDAAPEGLASLGRQLRKNNLEVERIPLDVPEPEHALRTCEAIAVVGSVRAWPKPHSEALQAAWQNGAELLLFLDPIIDQNGRPTDSGLKSLLNEMGVEESARLLLERNPEFRLPEGVGETFFAQVKTHTITQNLSSSAARLDARVIVTAAQALKKLPGSSAQALLESSPQAIQISDLSQFSKELDQKDSGPHALAMAIERSLDNGERQRAVVVGTSRPMTNSAFGDAILHGNQQFCESTFAWVLARPGLVQVPERHVMSAGLNLSEESLGALLRYVLLYMPLAAASAGALVLLRRRRREQDSRSEESHPA